MADKDGFLSVPAIGGPVADDASTLVEEEVHLGDGAVLGTQGGMVVLGRGCALGEGLRGGSADLLSAVSWMGQDEGMLHT